MPKRISIIPHLTIDELEQRYRQASDGTIALTLSNHLVMSSEAAQPRK